MALDTVGFLDAHQILATDLLGHSMGGKTAMTTALRYPERVRSLIVADMAPRAYTPGHDALLEALASLDLSSVTSRQQADEHLAAQGVSNWGVRQFLLKNLTRTDGGYAWAPNLDVLRARYEEVLAPVTSDNSYDGPTLFIRGGTSGYVRDDDWPGIERLFPNARLVTIPDAGHWVHAEAPQAFGDAVTTFLAEIDAG
jgi:pimeloyl-ACP methyl ester carboxylesterase